MNPATSGTTILRSMLSSIAIMATSVGQEKGGYEPMGPFLDGRFPGQTPRSGSQGAWIVEPAFKGLHFQDTTVLIPAPRSNRLYVASQQGVVESFEPVALNPAKRVFLDLSDRVQVARHGGFLGMAFHPEFNHPSSPHRGYLYVYYTAPGPFLRLSRLERPEQTDEVDVASELIMLNLRLAGRSHRGGGMTFGNDGFLYLSIGDQYQYETAQDIVHTLEGGILRIDVDRDPQRSHPPPRRFPLNDPEELSGSGYWIPNDNPFLDPNGGVFEEYYAIGNRNTHRLTIDRPTGRLWSGDVGQWKREEINLIEKGGNYGWPFREGAIAGEHDPPTELKGELKEPLLDFSRSEAASIIGGYVYRGDEYPDLWGKFLCGDYMTKRVWAITIDEAGEAGKELLTTFPAGRLSTFGVDHRGEIYLCGLGEQPLFKLTQLDPGVREPPARLSEVGAFKDLVNLEPVSAWWPYSLNHPSWSDGADKQRWMAIPKIEASSEDPDGSQIRFSADGPWEFPVGTVFMKHFEISLDERNPNQRKRLETRFLVHGEGGQFYGVTYRWRPDDSDADLLVHGQRESLTVQTEEGRLAFEWIYPSRNDCMVCHNQGAAFVLGIRAHQMNGMTFNPFSGRDEHQLQAMEQLNLFSPSLKTINFVESERTVPLGDESASSALRIRSYLDVNCAYCHHPDGSAAGSFDARFSTPSVEQGIIDGAVADDLGLSNPRLIVPGDVSRSVLYRRLASTGPESMPPGGHGRLDGKAAMLIADWIRSLAPPGAEGSAADTPSAIRELNMESLAGRLWLSFHRAGGGPRLGSIPWETSSDLVHWRPVSWSEEQTWLMPAANGRGDLVRISTGLRSETGYLRFFRINLAE